MTTTIPPATIDLKAALASIGQMWPQSEKIDNWSAKLAERPAQNTLIILGLSAAVFYAAERDANPKVNTIYDSLEYCSSSLSVGYTGIFPKTPIGKLVATFLMTYGPALTGAMLEGPKKPEPASDVTQQEILSTLGKILHELRRKSGGSSTE